MPKNYNWKTDFDWTDKNDEPVREAVVSHIYKIDYSFKHIPKAQVIPLDLDSPFRDYLNHIMKVNFKEGQ